jgi:hypothetical protein
MWRKTACAAAGLALALAAAYALTPTQSGAGSPATLAKSDRLPVPAAVPASAFAISFNLPHQAMTVVAKNPRLPAAVTSIRYPRDPAPAQAWKPAEQPVAQKPRLPEGCEPSFSPVTVPSLAHVAGRCTS